MEALVDQWKHEDSMQPAMAVPVWYIVLYKNGKDAKHSLLARQHSGLKMPSS